MAYLRLAVLLMAALPVMADSPTEQLPKPEQEMVLLPKSLIDSTRVQINLLIKKNEQLEERYNEIDKWMQGTNCT